MASCNCLMTSSRSAASVAVVTRKDPSRVKVVLFASKVAVTPHSFSRFCLRSKQAAKAQPTAWLSRSPCQKIPGQHLTAGFFTLQVIDPSGLTESLTAMKQWQIQRRVVPSLQMYENARSKFRSGAQNDTFSIVWSKIRSCQNIENVLE